MKALANLAVWAAALLFLTVAGLAGQETGFDPAATCEGKADGAPCWQQLDSRPGCHVWNYGRTGESASWTGRCNGSVAEGEGVLTWTDLDGATIVEGTFAAGRPVGRWRATDPDGTVYEHPPYVNGEIHGTQVLRFADGDVIGETRYVNGEEQPDP